MICLVREDILSENVARANHAITPKVTDASITTRTNSGSRHCGYAFLEKDAVDGVVGLGEMGARGGDPA
jgi:hypothetical protein